MSKPTNNFCQAPKMMPMWKVKKWLKEDDIGWVIIGGMVGLRRIHWRLIWVKLHGDFLFGFKEVDDDKIR